MSFSPAAINVGSAPANVTVNFSATDASAGIFYVEVGFVDPSGSIFERGSKTFTPPLSTSVTSTLTVTFPAFAPQGNWTVAYTLLLDAASNLTFVTTAPPLPTTQLAVTSIVDTTPPDMTAFTLSTTSINTATSSATVNMTFTLTDSQGPSPDTGISGAAKWQIAFTSPSGNATQTASFNATTPAATVNGTASVTFPQFSEAGTWTISSVVIADAVGNTKVLATSDLMSRGFTTTLSVASSPDTTPPTLSAFSFTPTTVNVTSAGATVTVSFQATDPAPNASGVNSFRALFQSPSGGTTLGAASNFAATTSASGSPTFTVPQGSEVGTWTVTSVVLTDAAGNVKTYATADLTALSFPTQLMVTQTPPPDAPVIVPTISPSPNGFGWNNTAVTVTWNVSDPGPATISSTMGCGSSTVMAETAGMTFTCSATNSVGATSSVSVTVRIDMTAPMVSPSITPAPNGAGWNNTNTTVSWFQTDALSGINSNCAPTTLTAETAGTAVTCVATDVAGNSSSSTVTVKIDGTVPVASNTIATPNPVQINNGTTITSTITDNLSGVASAQYNVDGGAFTSSGITGTFGGLTANISITIAPFTATGIHVYCVQGTDVAGNVGNQDCVIVAVFDPNGGFVTGGGAVNSPAGADAGNPTAAGVLSFGFNFKYLPNTNPPAPSGSLEVQFQAGSFTFKNTDFSSTDYLVITPGHAQVQGNGMLNGTIACKFQLDAWDDSFQPGNVDAFGLKIYNCSSGPDPFYNLATEPIARGNIQIHQ